MTHDATHIRAVREAMHPPVEGGGCLEQTQRYGETIVDQARAKRAARMPVQMALCPGMLKRDVAGEMLLFHRKGQYSAAHIAKISAMEVLC
jgi:hypothetical protein